MTDTSTIKTFADAETRLADTLPGYQSRPQQQALAAAVEHSFFTGEHLVSQAGCGTGKSLATAIPAILSGRRTAISTATKALQDQVANKDLPFLAEHLGVPFTYALLKGRSNYICRAAAMDDNADQVSTIVQIRQRMEQDDFDGERDNLGFDIEGRDWVKVTVSSEECPGRKQCPFGDECYAEQAKSRAQQANVVVVNHALLLTDLKVRIVTDGHGSMLGDFDALVVDEAHEFEDYAVSAFSTRTTQASVLGLTTEIRNWVARYNLAEEIAEANRDLLGATSALWETLEPGRLRPATIIENEDAWADMAIALNTLAEAITTADLGRVPTDDVKRARARKDILGRRARNLAQTFVDIATASDDDLVRWVEDESTRRGDTVRAIKSAPVDVSPILREHLFAAEDPVPVVLVSATIAVGGDFSFVAGRLGVDDYRGLDVGTPFDFERQARIYVPREMPAPAGSDRLAWESLAPVEILDLVRASRGRALVLFTSVRQMRAVHESIAARIEADGYEVLMQGDAPNKVLAENFKADVDSVLFATKSFFTGVDFPGETLSLVIIDKLPFAAPNDPIMEARSETVERRGGNSFADLVVPSMSLVLAQGFGRLIRTVTDRGVVAILDSRLLTKGYGKKILRSLPKAPVIEKIAEVEDFFAEEG